MVGFDMIERLASLLTTIIIISISLRAIYFLLLPFQVEALWALTNIAAGTTEHTHVLLRHNPVPALVNLLDSTNAEIVEQALWVLGNIAGEVGRGGGGGGGGRTSSWW